MKNLSFPSSNVASVSSYLQSDDKDSNQDSNKDSDRSDSAKLSRSRNNPAVGIVIAGCLTAGLLIALSYFFVVRPHIQKAGVQSASSADQLASEDHSLIDVTGLTHEKQHPNGTILQVNGISFDSDRTFVQLTITNTRKPKNGLIRLNQSWGNTSNTMLLKDDFGAEYPIIAAGGNPHVEVKPGTTLTQELTFRGKMNPATQTVTLVTNSKGGSPNNPTLQTPLIEVEIPVDHL